MLVCYECCVVSRELVWFATNVEVNWWILMSSKNERHPMIVQDAFPQVNDGPTFHGIDRGAVCRDLCPVKNTIRGSLSRDPSCSAVGNNITANAATWRSSTDWGGGWSKDRFPAAARVAGDEQGVQCRGMMRHERADAEICSTGRQRTKNVHENRLLLRRHRHSLSPSHCFHQSLSW